MSLVTNDEYNPFEGKTCVLLEDEQSANGLCIISKDDYLEKCGANMEPYTFVKEGSYEELSKIMDETPNLY